MTVEFPEQSLESALQTLATQTRTQLLFPADNPGMKNRVSALNGRFSVAEAFGRVLAGTSLKYQLVNKRTIVVTDSRIERKDGMLVFRRAPLGDVMTAVSAVTGKKICASGSDVVNVEITGVYRYDSGKLTSFLGVLQMVAPVEAVETDDVIVIRHKGSSRRGRSNEVTDAPLSDGSGGCT